MPMEPPGKSRPFHVMIMQGPTGSGKTALPMRLAPGAIAVHSTDGRWKEEAELRIATKGTDVVGNTYHVRVDLEVDEAFQAAAKSGGKDEKAAAEALVDAQAERIKQETWLPFKRDYIQQMVRADHRTTILDYADELYDWLRLANFGKLERNHQLAYVPVNHEYKEIVSMAERYSKNLILVHQLHKEYQSYMDPESGREKSRETGRFKRKGSNSAHYYIHSVVESIMFDKATPGSPTPGEPWFGLRIVQAKLNPIMSGEVIAVPETWEDLMALLHPQVPSERWSE